MTEDRDFYNKFWFIEWLELARRDYHSRLPKDFQPAPYFFDFVWVSEIKRENFYSEK